MAVLLRGTKPNIMSHTPSLLMLVVLLSNSGCCKLFDCDRPCPPEPKENTCCDSPSNTPGFTGGNDPGLPGNTTISASDIAVLVERTSVSVNADDAWVLSTEIAVDNGNNSTHLGDTHALVLLPADCQVKSVIATNWNGTPARWTQCRGYITVDLDQLNPAAPKVGVPARIDVVVARSEYEHSDGQPGFAVFAYSGRPDMRPDNNYWWWANTTNKGHTDTPLEGARWFPMAQPGPSRADL